MRPRHAVLLTPLESADPTYLLISIIIAPVTPLESALTSPSQLTENTATLSPTESALTEISPATPLESALTKNMGGGGLSFSGHSSSPCARCLCGDPFRIFETPKADRRHARLRVAPAVGGYVFVKLEFENDTG